MKPDNVLVYRGEDASELVKVVDFGISRAIRDESQHLTKSGFITGTCEFMSPEQVTGRALDHRTDIYALGLVAFMMFTGSLPFVGETPEMAMLVRLRDAPRRLDQAQPSVTWPHGLQDALDRALALEAGSRFDSAEEFAGAVEASVNASPPARVSSPVTSVRWRKPAAVAGAAIVVIVGVLSLYYQRPANPIESAAPPGKIVPTPTDPTAQERGEARTTAPAVTPAPVAPEKPHPKRRHESAPRPRPAPTPPVPPPGSLLDSYKTILRPDLPADSARQVIVSLDALLPRLATKRDSVEADIYRAEAYALSGEDEKACAILESARPYANSLQRRKMEIWVGMDLCKAPDWKAS